MNIYSVFSLISQWVRRTVLLFFAVLLMLAVNTESSATALDGSETGSVQVAVNSKEVLIRKAAFVNNSSSQLGSTPYSAVAAESASSTTTKVGRTPDWDGVWRDTKIVFGAQMVAVGATFIMPESFSGWTPEQKKSGFKKYADNFVNPVLDKDKFYVNYVLHPYWGSTYYIRGRERGMDETSSLIFATMLSAMYEFGVECIAEKPSIQDLIITPGLGALLGAYIFEPWRESIKRKQELRWYDHTVLVLTDPLGVLSLGVESMFGIKSTIMVDYSNSQMQDRSAGTAVGAKGNRVSLVMQFPLD